MRFHLGLDYGTSASKLILRHFEAPGGERAYLLEPKNRFRIPSAVGFDSGELVLNSDSEGSLKSLKMRYAGEITGDLDSHFWGLPKPIPHGFSAGDLVTLTVWKLLSIGHLEAARIAGEGDFKMGMTMGIPMSFLDNKTLSQAFLRVARVAYEMYRTFGPIGPDRLSTILARELLQEARSAVECKPPISERNLRNWIRSETEASMLWSFHSPAIGHGPFFCIDVGAGTTDACVFKVNQEHIDGQWRKHIMCFFGAHSHPYAVDALIALSDNQREVGFGRVRECLIRAAEKAYLLIRDNAYAVREWVDPPLIILGGGSFMEDLCHALRKHPMVNFRESEITRKNLTVPVDLVRRDESVVRAEDVAFTSVAYGLAQIGEAAPEAVRPTEVEPVGGHGRSSLPTHEEIYGD